jgi:DNA polymerase II small subunit/DNA polymerase delta subunit B
MSKVAIATELERHKHTKMPGMKEAITDKVVEVLKAPAKAVKKAKEVALPIPTAQKAMPSKMIKKAVAPVVAPAVPSKLVKGSQEARDRMNAVRAMKKKTA